MTSLAMVGCGRVGFEIEPDGDGGGTGGDGAGPGDGAIGDGAVGACANDLSGIGAGDFEIRFTLATLATVKTSLVFQRAACGTGPHWDVSLGDGGRAGLAVCEIAAGGSVGSTPTMMPVNDGAAHVVVCRRVAGVLSVILDGGPANTQVFSAPLGTLPPMAVGSGHPCTDLAPLVGSITDVCVRRL